MPASVPTYTKPPARSTVGGPSAAPSPSRIDGCASSPLAGSSAYSRPSPPPTHTRPVPAEKTGCDGRGIVVRRHLGTPALPSSRIDHTEPVVSVLVAK